MIWIHYSEALLIQCLVEIYSLKTFVCIINSIIMYQVTEGGDGGWERGVPGKGSNDFSRSQINM